MNMNMRAVRRSALYAGASALVFAAMPAKGQDGRNDTDTVDEIVVTGVRASILESLSQKRNETGFADAINAEDIGKFPDLNLSESLQRIPGVTLDRNAVGDGQAINLRGLGPEFTRVEINGMSGTSNGTGGRFGNSTGSRGFNFEILASELFSNAKVLKSNNASQEEGGLAGVVELETPKALDSDGFRLSALGLGNYSEISEQVDPRGALLISNNWNDTFGISASVSFSDVRFRSDTAEGGSFRPFARANTGEPAQDDVRAAFNPNGTRLYHFDEDRQTVGATLGLQWRPTDTFEIMVDGLYGTLDSERIITRDDMPIESGAGVPSNVTIQDGVITSGTFTGIQKRVGTNYLETDEELFQIVGRADWTPTANWRISPFIGYSSREADRIFDLYSFRYAENGVFDVGTVNYDIRGDFVDFGSDVTDFGGSPENFLFNVFILRPSNDKDTELNTKLDFEHTFTDGTLRSVQFGIRYADREKDRILTQERLQRTAGTDITVPPSLAAVSELVDYRVRGNDPNVPTQILSVNPDLVRDVFYPGGQAVDGTFIRPLPGFGAQQSYSISEETFNAYVQANFDLERATLDVGLRLVHTDQTSNGNTVANIFQSTEQITPISVSKSYTEYLPSANLRYDLTDELVFRAAYNKTLTRPSLDQLAPSETVAGIDEGGGTGTRGNPELDPFTADNFDIGLEWYFAEEGLLAATIFYKDIDGFIDTETFTEDRTFPRQADGVLVTGPILFTQPVNGVAAEITGLEIAAQARFTFLPGALANFGGIVNYTFTDSSADFAAEDDVRSQGLPGLSENSFNAVLYYDDGRLDARLAYAWRDRYLAQFADDFGVPRFTDAFGQLDLSASYRITDRLIVQLQALNLTREQFVNQSTDRFLPYGVAELDRRFLFGLRYTF